MWRSLFAYFGYNDHGICRVVKLLEKCPKQDRKEKEQKLLPDHTVRDPVVACRMILLKCHIFTLYKIRHAWRPFTVFSECMVIDTSALYLYLSAADTGRKYDRSKAGSFAAFKGSFYDYRRFFLSSSPLFAERYAGGISRMVLHPLIPSCFMRAAARAQQTITEEVNSGLESSFRRYSITCVFS